MLAWLQEELSAAVGAVRLEHFDRLKRCGVRPSAIADLGSRQVPFGVARVRPCGAASFEPDAAGSPALILPVFESYHHSGEPALIDLLALRTCEPNRVMRRTGEGWALGLPEIYMERPLPVVSSPLKWLNCAGEALFIFNWDPPQYCWRALHACPAFTTEEPTIARKLRSKLLACAICPSVTVEEFR